MHEQEQPRAVLRSTPCLQQKACTAPACLDNPLPVPQQDMHATQPPKGPYTNVSRTPPCVTLCLSHAQEAERKYAAEMVARQKVEREAREAEAAAAAAAVAAAAAAGPEVTTASEAEESTVGGSSVGFSGDQPGEKTKKKKGMSLLRKAAQRLGVKPSDKSSSSSKGAAAAAAAAAATAAGAAAAAGFAGAAAFSSSAAPTDYAASTASAGDSSIIYSTADSSALAEPQVPIEASDVAPSMYGWYGLSPSSSSLAALASIDTAVAAYAAAAAAGTDLPPPVTGTYARDPYGRILLGFDGLPLLLSITEGLDSEGQGSTEGSAEGTEVQPVLLNSQGEPLIGPHGEKIVMLLGAHNMPLADPHGRPVFVAETEAGQLRGVHPDGSIIMVPAAAEGSHGSNSHKHDSAAAAAAASDRGSSSSTFGDVGTGGMGPMQQGHYAYGSDSGGSGSIKEASSYAPSLSRTSVRSNLSSTAAAAAAAAGLPPRAPTGTPVAASPTAAAAAAAMAAAEPAAVAAMAHTAAYREGFAEGFVPATLVLGPSGRPLLGLDNRLLIVAVDEEGVPLVEGPEGQPLLGPDSKPLTLAYSSDGSLVALDSMCRPLVGEYSRLRCRSSFLPPSPSPWVLRTHPYCSCCCRSFPRHLLSTLVEHSLSIMREVLLVICSLSGWLCITPHEHCM